MLYQTNYTREMIERVGIDSKIEIVCPSTAKSELKMIVEFLYSGKISGPNQNVVYQASQNLTELFGFPNFSENPGQSFSQRKSCRKPSLNPALIRWALLVWHKLSGVISDVNMSVICLSFCFQNQVYTMHKGGIFCPVARDIHIECSKQFKGKLYFYKSGQRGPFWAELKLL